MRIDFEGLVAFELVAPDSAGTAAKQINAYFPDPWEHGLHPHAPRLVVPNAAAVDWARTSVSPLKSTSPLSFDLSGTHITLLPNGKPIELAQVTTPSSEIQDPDDASSRRKLAGLEKLLDMHSLCGDGRLKPEYASARPPRDLISRMIVDFGELRTASRRLGNFELWEFMPPHDGLKQVATDTVVWSQPSLRSLTFLLRSLPHPNQTDTITINAATSGTTSVSVRHTCDEATCGEHRGLHIPVYYEMAVSTRQRPVPSPPRSEGGYCPPIKFVR